MDTLSPEFLRTIPQLTGTPPPLSLCDLPRDPQTLFASWFSQAVAEGVPEPKALTMATVDGGGMPDARIVDLLLVDARGWVIGTGAASTKVAQLKDHPVAALNFWWQPQQRAVRVRGDAREVSQELMPGVPESFHIWRVEPQHVEFWQGGPEQTSDRIRYERRGSEWELLMQ